MSAATKNERLAVIAGAFRYGCTIEQIARVLKIEKARCEEMLREAIGGGKR